MGDKVDGFRKPSRHTARLVGLADVGGKLCLQIGDGLSNCFCRAGKQCFDLFATIKQRLENAVCVKLPLLRQLPQCACRGSELFGDQFADDRRLFNHRIELVTPQDAGRERLIKLADGPVGLLHTRAA